jgi:hypothetical protein
MIQVPLFSGSMKNDPATNAGQLYDLARESCPAEISVLDD